VGRVNLSVLSNLNAVSYRCPATSQTFKSRKEYSIHRKTMLRLKAAGKLLGRTIPPRDCVAVRAWDVLIPVTGRVGEGQEEVAPSSLCISARRYGRSQ